MDDACKACAVVSEFNYMQKIVERLFLSAVLFLVGCQQGETEQGDFAPWVKMYVVQPDVVTERIFSGTVRARNEIPVAFRISGRIEQRRIDAGQRVKKGDLLFLLDTSDLEKKRDARKAEASAARSSISVAKADVARGRDLRKKKFISQQSLDRFVLVEREAQERLNAALAHLKQAENALSYAYLKAEADGLITEVNGEQGEVISAGKTIALLAKEGELEVELFFPEGMVLPKQGQVLLKNGETVSLTFREKAGAADRVSHTWRARYSVKDENGLLALGNIVRASFKRTNQRDDQFKVPLAALDERGELPRVWIVRDSTAQPIPVELLSVDTEMALVRANLFPGDSVIALGTHLLSSGMSVRVLTQ